MNEATLRELKELFDQRDAGTCQHTRTHHIGCDDCGAVFCGACHRYHQGLGGMSCPFTRMLNDNAKDLIELASGSQQAVQEFIDCHHNPIVASHNKTMTWQQNRIADLEQQGYVWQDRVVSQMNTIDRMEAELKEANEFIRVLKDVMNGYQKVMGLK